MDINIQKMNFIDLFSGAGGLSEGFIRQGFTPIAHVEIDKAACNTLLTRTAYHHLKGKKKNNKYIDYLKREISRTELYDSLPENLRKSVINKPIGEKTNPEQRKCNACTSSPPPRTKTSRTGSAVG